MDEDSFKGGVGKGRRASDRMDTVHTIGGKVLASPGAGRSEGSRDDPWINHVDTTRRQKRQIPELIAFGWPTREPYRHSTAITP
ncbi:hypothetical protein PoB_006100000 [Plakobranchus ocellatus]|uniref:Uncharacterized protein n=1 Tax=Plakobranchus ocellatus TaxID=259542 RepID=A0AAV4CRN3_9GAST|nr:hypothetical protein PoB_006100000 [Plakobranchus ocellatus]